MSLEGRVSHSDPLLPWVITVRVIAGLALLGVWLFWASGTSVAGDVGFATTVWLLLTVGLLAYGLSGRSFDRIGLLATVVFVDGVALGMLTGALGAYRDPFLAWYAGEAVAVALLLRRRQALVLTGILAVSYLAGHLFGVGAGSLLELAFLGFNVVGLTAVAAAVSYTMGDQDERRERVEAQRTEVLALNARLQRSVAELRAITDVTELIHSTLEIESIGPALLGILEKVIDIPASALYVIDKTKHETIFSATSAGVEQVPRAFSGLELAGAVPARVMQDATLSCIEVLDHHHTLVVFCASADAIESLSPDDRIVLQSIASQLVVAVENARLYRLTKRLAVTDELSDLYNYRFLQQRLDEEIGRADRYGKRLSLLMLDVDDFKRINDLYGHGTGDTVLAEIGQVLKQTVREVDVVARYGGEEFTVILPETDASGAFIVAEKIREAISLRRFPDTDGVRSIHLTVSIGLAAYPVHANDKDSLLRAADDAVYRAKESGKDRVRAPRLHLRRLPAEHTTLEEVAE